MNIQNIQRMHQELIEKTVPMFKPVYQPMGRYVNDHCLIERDGEVHLFYIDGEVGKGCYTLGNETVIGHAVSRDLINWRDCGPALVHHPALPFEERGIFAPYVIEQNGRYWMFYCAHNIPGAQVICLAVSEDLTHWTRTGPHPLIAPTGEWALWKPDIPCSCRDPHLYYDEEEQVWLMFWVGDMRERPDCSCIAVSRSKDLLTWEELGPVLIRKHSAQECFTMKTESPCLIRKDGLFYLFYRHGNGTKYCISERWDDFTYSDSYYLCSAHAAEIFRFGGEWWITSCSREPGDITHQTDRSRGLYIARLDWEGMHPQLTIEN